MYYNLADEENALLRGVMAMEQGSNIDQNDLANFRDWKQMRFACDFLLNRRELIRGYKPLIFLLSEKLLTINKNAHLDEYNAIKNDLFMTIKNAVHDLIVQKKIDEALEFMKAYGFSIDLFLKEVNDLVSESLKRPNVEILRALMKICDMQGQTAYTKSALASWKQSVIIATATLFVADPLLILTVPENTAALAYMIGEKEMSFTFMENIIGLTEGLVENPKHKDIMSVFLRLNETFRSLGRTAETTTINLLIQATLQLRKIDNTSRSYASTLVQIFKDTSGKFAPMALIHGFYKDVFEPRNNKKDMDACDALAQFIGEANETILSFPNSAMKNRLLQEIGSITDILVQNYRETMLDRINGVSFDAFLRGDLKSLLMSIVGSQIPLHPFPFIEALDGLLSEWRRFPLLEKTHYVQNDRVLDAPPTQGSFQVIVQKLKPICWLSLFKDVFIILIKDIQQRLLKNPALQHRLLTRAILAQINYMHTLHVCINEETNVPRANIRGVMISFLKNVNNTGQISGAGMEGLLKRSEWRRETTQLLPFILEAKNNCVFCNFAMPRGTKTCPNCKRDAPPVRFETPNIDLGDMRRHFARTSSQTANPQPVLAPEQVPIPGPKLVPEPERAPEPASASLGDLMLIRQCPKCGGLISDDSNKCISCDSETPQIKGE
jgi:RNA polymerase subunit RPABC4/transcription elongation factor Spt4